MASILKKFSWEFLLGIAAQVLVVTWLVSSRVSGDELAIAALQKDSAHSSLDHDILIKVQADVENLVKSVDQLLKKVDDDGSK
jgi:Tfp pilus assembly protein PilN